MKLSKRIFATVLAALMAISMMPLTVFADDAADLQSAITAYETKMADSNVYKNLSAAYTAYVAACKGYDAYVYGGNTSVDLAGLKNTLTTATSNMTAWSQATTNTYATNDGNKVYSDDSYVHNSDTWYGDAYYKQAIWLQTGVNEDNGHHTSSDSSVQDWFRYPAGVFLYDGTNQIKSTIVMASKGGGKTNKNRYLVGAVVNNNNLSLVNNNWYGNGGNYDANWMLSSYHEQELSSKDSVAGTYQVRKSGVFSGSDQGPHHFANVITYSGTLTSSDSGYITITPQFTAYYNSETAWKTDDGLNGTLTGNRALYIINYKKLLDKINCSEISSLSTIANYKNGGASAFLAAYDSLTLVNPNSAMSGATIDNYGTKASDLGSAIDTAVNGMSGKSITADSVNADYSGIKTAITNYKTLRNTANTTYTAASFKSFTDAYDAAVNHMSGVTGGYNTSTATSLASTLNTAYGNLVEKTTITFVDYNGTSTTAKFDAGTAAATVAAAAPALPEAAYDEDGHNTYAWDKAFADVTTAAVTYTQVKTTTPHSFTYTHDENSNPSTHTGSCVVSGQSHTTAPVACTFVNGEHVAASGEANGYTEKVCSVCQFVDDAQKVYDNRDTSAYTTAVSDYEATKAAADYADFTAESKTAYETAVNAIIAAVNTDDQTKSTEYYNNRADEIIAANELLELPAPENTYNLTIEDTVEVNFNIDTEFYQAQGGTIEYSYLTTTGEESAERTEKVVQVDDIEEAGMSKITIEAAPAQIAEPYVITVKDSQGEVIDTITTSIQTYCHEIMDGDEYDQKDKDVAKALLNYGALANEYFSYADISEAVTGNEYIVDHTSDWKDAVDAESFKAKAKASFTTGADASGANVSITGISYVALLDPEFRFYVSQTNEVWAALTEVTVLEGEEGLTAKMFKNEENGKFCVVVKGLKASDFGKTFKIQIGEAILEYNGYAYLYTALRTGSTADEGLQNLAKGVYRYAAACEARFATV